MNRGVIYFAQGKKFFEELAISSKTFVQKNPGIPVILLTPDINVPRLKHVSDIIRVEDLGNPFKTKAKAIAASPFQYSLFLDTDTLIKKSVCELFDFLLNYDLAIANRVLCEWGKQTKFIDYVDETSFNTGVFAFRKNELMEIFLDKWVKEVLKEDASRMRSGHFCDQYHFNKIIFDENFATQLGLKIVTLPNKKYNARPHMFKQLKADGQFEEIKIFHAHFETSLSQKLNVVLNKAKAKFAMK